MPVADPLKMAFLDLSDFGNGKRAVTLAAGTLRWVEELQAWVHFDGRRYAIEGGNIAAQRLAHRVIVHIDEEASALAEVAQDAIRLHEALGWEMPLEAAQERVKALRAHAVKSGSSGMTAGMMKQARSELWASLEEFDRDPLTYNTLSHTLRFVEGKGGKWSVTARPHDQADMLMSVANVAYDPQARCPFWERRLAQLTPDADQLAALKPLYGYTLTGLNSDQAFYVHQGKGGDGKSATHMALADLHGDYYRHADIATFLQAKIDRGGSEHRADLERLRGDVRFVTADEPKRGSIWCGKTLKQVTGSLVTARGSGGRVTTTYKPRFKPHFEVNIFPNAPSDDAGFRRRMKAYQWKVQLKTLPEGEMAIDAVLKGLSDEKSGILNWLIAGALQWLETRVIPEPKSMTELLNDFWADASPVGEWMAEWCDTGDPHAKEAVKALYDSFKQWSEAAGHEHIMTATAFGRALRDRQFKLYKEPRGGARYRLGIRLRTVALFGEPAPPPPAAGSFGASPTDERNPPPVSEDDFDAFD